MERNRHHNLDSYFIFSYIIYFISNQMISTGKHPGEISKLPCHISNSMVLTRIYALQGNKKELEIIIMKIRKGFHGLFLRELMTIDCNYQNYNPTFPSKGFPKLYPPFQVFLGISETAKGRQGMNKWNPLIQKL